MSEKLTRADAKLQNLPQEALDELWRYRHPEEGGEAMTLEAICVELPKRFQISISISSLSVFYRWLELRRRLEQRECVAEQLKAEMARNPANSEEAIRAAGQRLFMAEGIIEKDFKKFTGAAKMTTDATKLQQAEKKIALLTKAGARDERKLAILEAKAALADAAEQVSKNGAMSAEEKQSRMKEIFGF